MCTYHFEFLVFSNAHFQLTDLVHPLFFYCTCLHDNRDVSNNALDTIEASGLLEPHGLFANNNSFSSFGNAMNLSESVKSLYVPTKSI